MKNAIGSTSQSSANTRGLLRVSPSRQVGALLSLGLALPQRGAQIAGVEQFRLPGL
jgi:hypothetical protein